MNKEKQIINIAVLLTCYNRKSLTLSCLEHVLKSCKVYNDINTNILKLHFYITDDNCSDGTADAVSIFLKDEKLTIIKADGNAFWAGGMRLAWRKSLEQGPYDFYLLLNDDTRIYERCFQILLDTHQYCLSNYHKGGIYTAFTADPNDENLITYGAKKYNNGVFFKAVDLIPTGTPQICSLPNANILLVSNEVCSHIGILSDEYIHGGADWDYGMMCSKAGFPVLTSPCVCGLCKNDHKNVKEEAELFIPMSIKKRKDFANKPTREYLDGFTFLKKYDIIRYWMMRISYYLNIYTPNIYYKLLQLRGHK